MYVVTGSPLEGRLLSWVKAFLGLCGLEWDEAIAFTAVLLEDDEIAATGSLDGDTIKCVAVAPEYQGQDLTAQIMTVLFQEAAQQGIEHLLLYTKPHNGHLFQPLGFHPVIRTPECLLMENRRDGLSQFLAGIEKPRGERVGCVVANCDPFTLGHRKLIETAAKDCTWVHVFILSQDRGMFSAARRLEMARAGLADLSNVLVHPTGPYMVSASTFPTYFIKDKTRTGEVHCELDVCLFAQKIAPALSITHRYVGTEPSCAVTAQYNRRMKQLLPQYGIEVIELERFDVAGEIVSASRIRQYIREHRFEALEALLPVSSLRLIQSK
ncbi:MAG: [Clostridia bacterium]|nr:[citrate (pro-3S)-lyase] ligase [Clostridia bacterium]